MKIIYIHQYFETPNQFGGLRTYQNALHMVKKGHKVTVISGAANYHASETEHNMGSRFFRRQNIDGIDVIWVNALFSYHRSFFHRLLSFATFMLMSIWAGLRAPGDIVYATSPPLTVIVPGFIVSRIKRVKLLFEVRDLWPESAVTTGVLGNPVLIKIAEWMESFAYRKAHGIVAVSEGIRDVLAQRGIEESKLSVVHHGADLEFLDPTRSDGSFRRQYDLGDRFVALYAGTFGWANGLETIVEAAELLRDRDDIRIVLMGDGKEKQALFDLVAQKNLPNLIFAQPVPKQDIVLVMGDADVGLMTLRDSPTFATVLPNKLLDYLGCGLPVIINFKGFASRIVEQAQGGIVISPGDAGALRDAIVEMASDRDASRAQGQSGRRYIVENYSREAAVHKFEQILQKTLNTHKTAMENTSTVTGATEKNGAQSSQEACNLCGSTQLEHLFDETPMEGYTFSVVKCRECGLIATSPAPSDEFLAQLYDSGSYKENTVSGTYCLDEHISSVDFQLVLRRLRQLGRKGKLLDVGCGVGAFVQSALAKDWDAYGIEPSPFAGEKAVKELGERAQIGFLKDGGYEPESFDAITLWYVLEHVTDPTTVLEECYELLKPGGVIFIGVPNARYIWLRRRLVQLKSGQAGTVHAHEHLFQYTSQTLKQLLSKTGFEPIAEHSASPYMVSGATGNAAKRVGKFMVNVLFKTSGVNMGGLLVFGRKPKAVQ